MTAALETPQYFWMRIAMGLALEEQDCWEARALDFYEALSTFRSIPSHLILSHARPGPSFFGRRNQSRSTSLWMEPSRRDILNSLDSKRLRIPVLFMKRVHQQTRGSCSILKKRAICKTIAGALMNSAIWLMNGKPKTGALRFAKRVNAADLWLQIVASSARSGQAWLGFKDAMRLRSPGPEHASRAFPVGAINLAHFSDAGGLDEARLRETVTLAVRMLDNAVDLSLWPSQRARLDALECRNRRLGHCGISGSSGKALAWITRASCAAADLADWSTELVSWSAIMASAGLARQRGPFPAYARSKWPDGVLPIDTLQPLEERAVARGCARRHETRLEFGPQELIRRIGMRNCAQTAIRPSASPPELPA